MAKRPSYTYQDFLAMDAEQLYKIGKSNRDALKKREKLLERNIAENPGKYSPFGLKVMQKEGIPEISKKDHVNTLRGRAWASEKMRNLKTTSSTGAKQHIEEMNRRIAGVPIKGKLEPPKNATDEEVAKFEASVKRYEEVKQYHIDNPDALSNHWEAFDVFKKEMRHTGMDSNQLLDLYRPQYETLQKSGTQIAEDLNQHMRDYADEWEMEQDRREDMAERLHNESFWGSED